MGKVIPKVEEPKAEKPDACTYEYAQHTIDGHQYRVRRPHWAPDQFQIIEREDFDRWFAVMATLGARLIDLDDQV